MADFGEGFILQVTPERLKEIADDAQEKIDKMSKAIDSFNEAAVNTKSYWNGEASDLYAKRYKELKDKLDEIMKRLSEYPRDLEVMAGVYEETESVNTETWGTLDNNIVV